MISEELKRSLQKCLNGTVLFDEPLKFHTSFKIGGPIDALVIPKDENDLKCLLNLACREVAGITVIGNGTKLLVSDEGVDGIGIKISGCFDDVTIHGDRVVVGGGHLLSRLSILAADHALSGLEFAIGIPGTVGGGIVMNAGAHGSMISDVLTFATAMSFDGQVNKFTKEEFGYGYRQSAFQNKDSIILNATIDLRRDVSETIRKRINEYTEWRKGQPMNLPNAGSVFKNPVGASAGHLIDMAGLKGLRVGSAQISGKHGNFIVNLGNATANDVLSLMDIASKEVLRKFGVALEPEVKVVGRFTKACNQSC